MSNRSSSNSSPRLGDHRTKEIGTKVVSREVRDHHEPHEPTHDRGGAARGSPSHDRLHKSWEARHAPKCEGHAEPEKRGRSQVPVYRGASPRLTGVQGQNQRVLSRCLKTAPDKVGSMVGRIAFSVTAMAAATALGVEGLTGEGFKGGLAVVADKAGEEFVGYFEKDIRCSPQSAFLSPDPLFMTPSKF
jgi:hypothetical protein